MTKHTPGPWGRNIPPATHYPTIFAGRNTHVATVNTKRPEAEVEANCNLIIAAPDMLAALKELADLVDDHVAGVYRSDSFTTQPARAAIAKAEGL